MPHPTRDRLVSTAMRLFREKGYGATSVANLLKAAGAHSGSLYSFFPGKQELLLAVLDAYRRDLRETLLEPAWRSATDPIERIFILLQCQRQLIVDSDCLCGCPIGSLALEMHEPDARVRERFAAYLDDWTDAVHRCLLETDSRLPDDLDRRGFAEFVLATMEGAVIQALVFRDVAHFDRAVQQLRNYVDILLYGRRRLSPVRGALASCREGLRTPLCHLRADESSEIR